MLRYPTSTVGEDLIRTLNFNSSREESDASILPRHSRRGVLKTVGDPSLGSTRCSSEEPIKVEIPVVDFGTTITPTLTPGGNSRPATATGFSSNDDKTSPGSQSSSQGIRASPNAQSARPPSRLWQPVDGGRQSPPGSLTAEQFVQQRAAAARIPHSCMPHRSLSYSKIERSPTKLEQRRTLSGRPSSRQSHTADYPSANLSAREQEHMARMTGGPLIQVVERPKTPDPFIGLVGAIEARQQEKRMIKQELAGHMVEQASWHRQLTERNYAYQQDPAFGNTVAQSPISWTSSNSFSPLSEIQQPWTGQQIHQNQHELQQQQIQHLQRGQRRRYHSSHSAYYS